MFDFFYEAAYPFLIQRSRMRNPDFGRRKSVSLLLEAKNCGKSFKGLQAVKNFSAQIETGKIYGLIGTNGAGKTTVINMLSGVLEPTSGQILYDGKDITGWKPDRVAKAGILRTYQNLRLFGKMTALENTVIGAQMHRQYNFLEGFCTRGNSEKARRPTMRELTAC